VRTDFLRVERSLRHRGSDCGFSLIELVIVVVIIGIIGAIAIPRMSSAAENSAKNAVIADQSTLQRAIDMYATEHGGTLPHVGSAGAKEFYQRLYKKTDALGNVTDSGIFGPYINGIPANQINGLNAIRQDGAAAGANTHGWRYNTVSGAIEADHLSGATGYKGTGDTVKKVTEDLVKALP
jgi:prepilin-type N-terminal cleavage/methylation domain-containing protein